MAFNSNTYHRNRCRREAAAHLEAAREIKARLAAGQAFDWERPLVASYARRAILAARMARCWERIARLKP